VDKHTSSLIKSLFRSWWPAYVTGGGVILYVKILTGGTFFVTLAMLAAFTLLIIAVAIYDIRK